MSGSELGVWVSSVCVCVVLCVAGLGGVGLGWMVWVGLLRKYLEGLSCS